MLIKGEQTLIGQTSNKQNQLIAGDNISMVINPIADKTTINANIDLSNYYNKSETDDLLAAKQNELVAGSNISLIDDPQTGKTTISATGGSGGTQYINMYETGSLIQQVVDNETISIPLTGDNIVGLNVEYDNKQYIIIFSSPVYRDNNNAMKWRDITSPIITDLLDDNITFEWSENTGVGGGIIISITTMSYEDFTIYPLYQKQKTQP